MLSGSSESGYDPRFSAVYIHIGSLNCGWAKLDEFPRHILNFKQSGKLVVAYAPSCREKEYYLACACDEIDAPPSAYFSLFGLTVQASIVRGVLDNVGIETQVERIGKYKSTGDQLTRRTMSDESCEMLTTLLDNIYTNWLDKVSSAKGKKREDIENFINEGVYQVDRLKEEGFISDIIYDDKVVTRKYCGVRKWTLGISGGKELIAIIRASGSIRCVEGPLSVSSSCIVGEKFIETIRSVRAKFWPLETRFLPKTVDKMEEVEHGRVWTGKDAASHGLVDAIGGLSQAIAIAKLKANIPEDRMVTAVELSRPSPSITEIISGQGNSLVGVDRTIKELLKDLTLSNGVQERMDGIMFQILEGYPNANPILALIKYYLSS
ncbi:hypothetical protein RIF29_07862 [Crotalaria pallida]|uniref:Peptidase S49 domain-containing protein n=1 Tax=Crotalaria pallida TaxID=3830 RepID=A0AAN9J5G9_CROPI